MFPRCKMIIAIVVLASLIAYCTSMPFIDEENALPINSDVPCYGYVCPVGTQFCKKIMKTSKDKTAYETSIYCVGEHHRVVDEKHFLDGNPNPNGPRIKMVSMNGRVIVNKRIYR